MSGTAREGRNTRGTLFFKGDTIYSDPDIPIARIATGQNGARGVLFVMVGNSDDLTSKHSAQVFALCLNIKPAFIVPLVTAGSEAEHATNVTHYTTQIRLHLEHADASIDENTRAFFIMGANSHREEALTYAKFFGLSADNLPEVAKNELAIKKQEKLRRDADAARQLLGKAGRAWRSEPPDFVQ
jgi:hypothetical protein